MRILQVMPAFGLAGAEIMCENLTYKLHKLGHNVGAVAALLYRSNDIILYTNKHILNRSALKKYKLYALNFIIFIAFATVNYFINIAVSSFLDLVIKAVIVCILVFSVFFTANIVLNRKILSELRRR